MNTTTNNLCIIPARGGSKRIPRKNIKDFLGKPIIAYSIEAALGCGLFSEVMVSTDDEEIAEIALKYGAKVPFLRSEKNADDYASTLDVLREVVGEYEKKEKHFDYVCCIYPTAPFVSSVKLKEAYVVMIDYSYDSVIPVMKYTYPIQRAFEKLEDNKIKFLFDEHINSRSQDLQDVFHDVGQFYWMQRGVLNKQSVLTENTGAVKVDELDGQDIDNETDWQLAELKYKLLYKL